MTQTTDLDLAVRRARFTELAVHFRSLADAKEAAQDLDYVEYENLPTWRQEQWGWRPVNGFSTEREYPAAAVDAEGEPVEDMCGVHACIAGWTVLKFGPAHFVWKYDRSNQRMFLSDTRSRFAQGQGYVDQATIQSTAKELLGLDEDEAERLFDGEWVPEGFDEEAAADGREWVNLRALADQLDRYAAGHYID